EIDEHPLYARFEQAVTSDDGSSLLAAHIRDPRQESAAQEIAKTLLIQVDTRGCIVRSRSYPGRIGLDDVLATAGGPPSVATAAAGTSSIFLRTGNASTAATGNSARER